MAVLFSRVMAPTLEGSQPAVRCGKGCSVSSEARIATPKPCRQRAGRSSRGAMKAIILAAGTGSRLDQSGETVKSLLKFGSSTLIELQCKFLRACGISEINVVVGFEAERVRRTCGPGIEYIENPIFAKTNSLYSLWLAREYFSDGFVVINSDVLFHPQLLWDLLTARHEDALLISYREEM